MKQLLWMALGALIAAGIGAALGQGVPSTYPGCVYNATPPVLTNGQNSVLQCDVNGKLRVTTS